MTFSVVPIEAFQDKRLTLEQLRVLGALLSFRNPKGDDPDLVWPSRQAIAERCGIHVANISSATSALERLGWLTKEGKGGHSKATRYTISTPSTVAQSATVAEWATVAQSATPTVAEQATRLPLAESATRKEVTKGTDQRETLDAKGTRLPADWFLPHEWKSWSVGEMGWSDARCNQVADVFADYWRSLPGKKASRLDWFATWRNWCRRESASAPRAAVARRAPSAEKFSTRDYGRDVRL